MSLKQFDFSSFYGKIGTLFATKIIKSEFHDKTKLNCPENFLIMSFLSLCRHQSTKKQLTSPTDELRGPI